MSLTTCERPKASEPTVATILARLTARPKVLHIINGEHYSGAERVQDLLALNLPEFGYEVGFACLKPGRFSAMRQSQQTPLDDLTMNSRIDLRPALQLARTIKARGYSLVHTHTPRAALIGRMASALARVPFVHHVHSPTASDSTHGRQDRLNAWIERHSLSTVSGVITVSQSLAGYAESQGILPASISVVPNGVPTRGPLLNRQSPRGTWTLGAVALFRPRKGLEVLLESLALLKRQGILASLRAIGDFETSAYEREIKERVQRLGISDLVHWVGFTQDVPGELAKLDLFVLPSLFGEGLPMVILEAMAAGVPIACTRVEGVPEAIRDGLDGLVARPNDPMDLARKISKYLLDEVDWSRIRQSAHRRQAETFSVRSMAAGVAKVYDKVLAQ